MDWFLVAVLLIVAALIGAGLYRVWAGPTVFDRLVAVALLSVNGVVVIVLLGFVFERPALFLDIALGYALLAFLLPIALGRFFEQYPVGGLTRTRRSIERPRPTDPAADVAGGRRTDPGADPAHASPVHDDPDLPSPPERELDTGPGPTDQRSHPDPDPDADADADDGRAP
jgi:multicomponent Na+:H+ antiporter subunit F